MRVAFFCNFTLANPCVGAARACNLLARRSRSLSAGEEKNRFDRPGLVYVVTYAGVLVQGI